MLRIAKGLVLAVGLGVIAALAPMSASAATVNLPVIVQVDISGDEFVVLTNRGTTPIDLGQFWLGHSSDPAQLALPEAQLPSGLLAPGRTVVLSRTARATCGAQFSGQLGFALTNSAGALGLWQLSGGNKLSQVRQLTWGAEDADGHKLPTDLANLNHDDEDRVEDYIQDNALSPAAAPVWYFGDIDGTGGWHVGYEDACTFTEVKPAKTTTAQPVDWQSAGSPPFVLAAAVSVPGGSPAPHIPAGDRGLKAIQLSEILPNPAKPQTDAEGEFIELYNPNARSFDLSDFILQTVSASSGSNHLWHIPAGTSLGPHQFKAFKSSQAHFSLANEGGQAWLLDPLGHTVSKSEPWGKAADGMAWINAGGKWQWSAIATPGKTNKLAANWSGNSGGKTAKVGDKKVTQLTSSSAAGTNAAAPAGSQAPDNSLTVHPLTLAAVVAAALLYGGYEYRHDLANRYRQFRRQRAARR